MSGGKARSRTGGLIAVALVSFAAIAEEQQMPVALLLECKCTVDGKSVAPADMPKLLYPGQTITCEGKPKIEYDRIIFPRPPAATCLPGNTIKVASPPPAFVAGARTPLGVFDNYVTGGRSKGAETSIYEPADGGAVVSDRFTIRWTTKPDIGTFVAVLIDPAGKEIARSGKLKGTDGTADSEPFRRAILTSLGANPASGRFQLTFKLDEGGEQTSNFTVLTRAQESDLDRELARIGDENSLFGHLERAGIFDKYRLYNDVAAEYDRALDQAPNSVALLRAAVGVDARIGDLERAHNYTVRTERAAQH